MIFEGRRTKNQDAERQRTKNRRTKNQRNFNDQISKGFLKFTELFEICFFVFFL